MRMLIGGLLLVGCSGPDPVGVPDEGVGLVGDSLANPFPSTLMLATDGTLQIDPGLLTLDSETPLPLDRLGFRTGFSPAQPSVVRLPGIRAEGLPGFESIDPDSGTVRMVDLTAGTALPCMAELDAYPNVEEPSLIIRPLQAVPIGHQVGVLVTTAAAPRPARFDQLLSDAPPPSLADAAAHHRQLVDDLASVTGVPAGDIALAWDFPVGDGTRPLTSALEQLTVPGSFEFTRIRELDAADDVAPLTWRVAEGTYDVVDFLVDDVSLDMAADGSVSPVGQVQAELYVHIPTSVADAPAGSVPVLVFGHGIFAQPSNYLDEDDDPSGVLQLAEDAGVIVIATTWRGLTWNDRGHAIQVAGDFGRFPELTDRLVQAQVNVRTLIELASTEGLLDDPVFQGASGQQLPDASRLRYYGISLGGIEGAVMWAQDPPLDAAAFHVGGAMWSTMLERSSNWTAFELLIPTSIADAGDRQIAYALSQLWWDPVDPISWTEPLSQRPFLLQESIGDEQVPNMTTEALARSVGLPILTPQIYTPWGVEPAAAADLPQGASVFVQFDPEVPLPPPTNRPAPVSGAHHGPRTWSGARLQVVDYLRPGAEGTVVHHCGAEPCTATNPGP